ncbi:MAG: regulator of ime2 [Sclerophora amabilis]|nr:MAG: regulator of ime2 [Sclerophora amabilis]
MLRPATPLSVLLFAAFVLLLISVISTPVIKGIKIAAFNGVDFGVFGYCQDGRCSGPEVGYSDHVFSEGKKSDFSLPSNTRHSLSSLLIVHPIAAFLTLILLVLSAAAHLHSPSHSPRYLLALLILTLPTLLLTLLAFLVDILMFVPHLEFGGWLVLAATILIAASGIVTCAMRRTLVSRKARKKRIAENADMNGENFYSGQNGSSAPPMSAAPTAPIVNGSPGADKLPEFATFDVTQKANGGANNDERVPLNPNTPVDRSKSRGGATPGAMVDGANPYRDQPRSGSAPPNRSQGYTGGRDEFGNPLPPSSAFGPTTPLRRDPSDPALRHQDSGGTVGSSRSGGPSPFNGRGRGGFPPNGRGFGRGGPQGGWRGPPPMPSHGYNGTGRGMGPGGPGMGMGGMMMGRDGQQGGPPPGYGNGYHGGSPARGGVFGREPSPYGAGYNRRPSPGPPSAPGYGRKPSPGAMTGPAFGRRPTPPEATGYGGFGGHRSSSVPSLDEEDGLPRAESPPPPLPVQSRNDREVMFGQAVEMDATTGSPSPSLHPPASYNQLRDSDGDVRGMVGLQQDRHGSPMRQASAAMTTSSVYSANAESYVPPRSAWAQGDRNGTPPLNTTQLTNNQVQNSSPVELPTANSGQSPHRTAPGHARAGSGDNYYEDVDPRFAEPPPTQAASRPALPPDLQPGYDPAMNRTHSPGQHLHPTNDRQQSYEHLHDASRSPAASDTSNYTSVSQRGVNPDWHPSMSGEGNVVPRRPVQGPSRDVIFASNNDFELPNGRGRGGRGVGRGARTPGQIPPMAGPAAGGGRYPTANEI